MVIFEYDHHKVIIKNQVCIPRCSHDGAMGRFVINLSERMAYGDGAISHIISDHIIVCGFLTSYDSYASILRPGSTHIINLRSLDTLFLPDYSLLVMPSITCPFRDKVMNNNYAVMQHINRSISVYDNNNHNMIIENFSYLHIRPYVTICDNFIYLKNHGYGGKSIRDNEIVCLKLPKQKSITVEPMTG